MNEIQNTAKRQSLLSVFLRNVQERSWFLPVVFAVAVFLVFLPGILISDLPMSDVHSRYAPMAEEFAERNWAFAFHPRIPPFLPVLGGCFVKIFGVNGFFGVKLASLLCFSLSFLGLIPLFRRVFDLRTTVLAGALAMFLSPLLRLVFAGLREPVKGMFFIFAAYCLVRLWQEKRSLYALLLLGFSCAGMSMVKDDSVLLAFLFLAAAFCIEIFRSKRFPWHTILAGILALILLTPLLILNYRLTGYPVPSNRFVPIAEKLIPFRCFDRQKEWSQPQEPVWQDTPEKGDIPIQGPIAKSIKTQAPKKLVMPPVETTKYLSCKALLKMVRDFFAAFYLWYFIPALAVIFFRIRRKQWTGEDTIILLVPLVHSLLLAVQILVSDRWFFFPKRYSLAVVPLFCGWTARAILYLYDFLKERMKPEILKRLIPGIMIIAAVGLYAYGLLPEIHEHTSKTKRSHRTVLFAWADAIKKDYKGISREKFFYIYNELYISFRKPYVYSDALHELGYLSGGESLQVPVSFNSEYTSFDYIKKSLCPENKFSVSGVLPDYIAEEVTADVKGLTREEAEKKLDLPLYDIMDRKELNGHQYVLWKISEKKHVEYIKKCQLQESE